jgi:hypothetical protein
MANQSLPLSTITPSQLEQWFEHVAAPRARHSNTESSSPLMKNQLLSQFGIHSSLDVIAFLKSPAGLIAQALFNEKISEIIAMQNNSLRLSQKALAQHRALAFYLLGLLHKREEAKKHLLMLIHQQNEILLQNLSKKVTPITANQQKIAMLEDYFHHYQEARKSLEEQLHVGELLSQKLEEEWLAYEQMIFIFQAEQTCFDRGIKDFHTWFSNEMDHAQLEEKLTDLMSVIQWEQEKIDESLAMPHILDEPALLIRLQENEARKLQLAFGHDYQNALPISKKIIIKEGKHYLIPANQTFANLSVEAKDEAHQAYASLKPRFQATQSLVNSSRKREQERHVSENAMLSARSDLLQQDVTRIANQLNEVQASIAFVTSLIKDARAEEQLSRPTPKLVPSSTPTPKPMPTVKPKSQPSAATPSAHPSCIYRLEMCRLRNNPQQRHPLTQVSLNNLNSATAPQQQVKTGVPMSPMLAQALFRYNNGIIAQQMRAISPIHSPNLLPVNTPFSLKPKMRPPGM